jgi:hypothetical protein
MYIMGYIDMYGGFWLWPQIIGAITDMYIADYPKPTLGDTQILVKVNNVSDLIFSICLFVQARLLREAHKTVASTD